MSVFSTLKRMLYEVRDYICQEIGKLLRDGNFEYAVTPKREATLIAKICYSSGCKTSQATNTDADWLDQSPRQSQAQQ